MALLWLDDFESYNSSNEAAEAYTITDPGYGSFDTSFYYTGTRSYFYNKSYNGINKALSVSANPIIVGFAWRHSVPGQSYNSGIFYLLDENGNDQMGWTLGTRIINMHRARGGADYFQKSYSYNSSGTWSYVELKIKVTNSTSAGDLQIYKNGEQIFSIGAGVDTQNQSGSTVKNVQWRAQYLNAFWIDNIYICDTTGSDNNDILGMPLIETLYPNGNGNQNDFIGSDLDSTDNYLHVDEAQQDEDTSYVQSTDVGDIDLYAMETIDNSDISVLGIQVSSIVKECLGGDQNIQQMVRTASTNYTGSSKTVSGNTYQKITTIWENNPNDSQPWEKSDIDGLESGIKVVV